MNIENNFGIYHAFAIGYYDGRVNGYEQPDIENMTAEQFEAYGRGYQAGVNDFEMTGE